MNKSAIYIVGAIALLGGGAYLFLKNKKAKDLAKLDELGGATSGGSTSTGGSTSGASTSGGATSDGVNPSDANLNLANATVLVGKRASLVSLANKNCVSTDISGIGGMSSGANLNFANCSNSKASAKKQLVALDEELAKLGYKVDATGKLVKI